MLGLDGAIKFADYKNHQAAADYQPIKQCGNPKYRLGNHVLLIRTKSQHPILRQDVLLWFHIDISLPRDSTFADKGK